MARRQEFPEVNALVYQSHREHDDILILVRVIACLLPGSLSRKSPTCICAGSLPGFSVLRYLHGNFKRTAGLLRIIYDLCQNIHRIRGNLHRRPVQPYEGLLALKIDRSDVVHVKDFLPVPLPDHALWRADLQRHWLPLSRDPVRNKLSGKVRIQ